MFTNVVQIVSLVLAFCICYVLPIVACIRCCKRKRIYTQQETRRQQQQQPQLFVLQTIPATYPPLYGTTVGDSHTMHMRVAIQMGDQQGSDSCPSRDAKQGMFTLMNAPPYNID